ncbi:GDSL-like Lipase/Acylhydrolase-domain-containing protein [Obelidium mucronatum]|nr:GDSL-like Lipase/Acylhydrolase-domain-containing protein [Obelidium mucronatum]
MVSGLVLLTLAVTTVTASTPVPIKSIVTLGDSLSDTGNVFKIYGIPPAPYWKGRFTNGPNWVEHLSGHLSNATLYNFAYGGSTANVSNSAGRNLTGTPIPVSSLPDVSQQLALFQKDPVASKIELASTLFTIFSGGNDINYQIDAGKAPDVRSIAGSVVALVSNLVDGGAKNILINNMPPLHLSPRMKPYQSLSAQIKKLVDGYNQVLAASIAGLSAKNPSVTIAINDVNGLLTFISSPEGSKTFNLANVGDQCLNATAKTVCASPETYFFWDGIHPTTNGQDLIAQYGYNQFYKLPGYLIAKPEPTTSTATAAATATATSTGEGYKPTPATVYGVPTATAPATNLYSAAMESRVSGFISLLFVVVILGTMV